MKRMTRRLLAMLLAALMMVSALPVYAAGEPLSPSPELLFLDNGVFLGKN